MSRSVRKSPFSAITFAETDKPFKRATSQARRASFRTQLASLRSDDDLEGFAFIEAPRAHTNPWDAPKDGRRYLPGVRTQRTHRGRMLVVSRVKWKDQAMRK